jgi:hypothetical protein
VIVLFRPEGEIFLQSGHCSGHPRNQLLFSRNSLKRFETSKLSKRERKIMKMKMFGVCAALVRRLGLPTGLLLGQTLLAAVTFNVTPSAVSNTYAGTITLQIDGLTNKTVIVQKFLDLNTNGVIDDADLLVQQFTVQDGINFVIGGVTNFNVPGDLNATTGAITATLNFQNGDFVQNIVGNYLFRLSNPGGHFEPLTNQFAVTNFPFPQTFTGNVVSNSTSTTLPNAVVLLFPPPRPGNDGPSGNPLAGVVANNAGSYTVQVPPGIYMPVAFENNYAANMATAPVLTLAASQTLTNNLTLTSATAASISGSVVDANNSSIGLPGVMIPAMSSDGLLAITFTDTNGNFNVPVTAGNWGFKPLDTALIVHGYLRLHNGTNVAAGATGVTLAVPRATALIYGSVMDNLGNPMVGIDVEAYDINNNEYESDGYTDANGNYVVGVLGGLADDNWHAEISPDSNPANYDYSQNDSTSISAGQAVLQNFTAILATNYITGTVKDSSNNLVAGIGVNANATINGTNYQASVDTDTSGNYSLNVANGSWNISINCNGGDDSLNNILGSGAYQCPDIQTAVINNNNATNNFIIQPCSVIIQIFTTSLPAGEVNVYYDQFLQGSSCSGSFDWSLSSGSLPPGLTADHSSGEIFGTPTNAGTFNFTVQATDNNGHSTNQALSLTITNATPVPDVLAYYVTKLEAFQQLDAANIVLNTNAGPFNAFLGIVQSSLGAVPIATVTLPTGAVKGLPWGSSAIEMRSQESFPSQASFDAAYPPGTYAFGLYGVNDGLRFPVLSMPPPVYPNPPHVSNFASAQSLNPLAAFTLQWDAIPGGTTNDTLWVFITDATGNPVFSTPYPPMDLADSLEGTATSVVIPTSTFQFGHAYVGTITFFRWTSVNTTGYPGAVGATVVAVQTWFPLAMATASPVLSQPAKLSSTRFGFQLSGFAGQDYTILASTNLSQPMSNWVTVLTTNLSTSPAFIEDNQATNKQRFYRVKFGL